MYGIPPRPLTWDELEPLLAEAYPDLHASFRAGRRPWNRKPEKQQEQEEAAAAAAGSSGDGGLIQNDSGGGDDEEGWQLVGRGKRNRNRGRRFSDLVAEDWMEGYPELDWRRGRLAGAGFPPPGVQQAAAAAVAGTAAAGGAGQGACVATARTWLLVLEWMNAMSYEIGARGVPLLQGSAHCTFKGKACGRDIEFLVCLQVLWG